MKPAKTTKDKLIAKYHVLTKNLNVDEKEALLSGYGVKSSKELDVKNLLDLCGKLEKPALQEPDQWRKRVIAAVCAWQKLSGLPESVDQAKAIACRASGYGNFNSITVPQLRNVYYEFVRKANVAKNAESAIAEIVKPMTFQN